MGEFMKFKNVKKPEFWGISLSVAVFTIILALFLTGSETATTTEMTEQSLENLSFHSDTSALASMMMIQPMACDYTAGTYTFRIKYDERLFGTAPASFQESWEATVHSMPLSEAPSHDMKEYPVYVDIDSLSLNYDPENMCFGATFDIYADMNHTHPIDPVYVTYIWDEATNQFIMDLDSARIQLAG